MQRPSLDEIFGGQGRPSLDEIFAPQESTPAPVNPYADVAKTVGSEGLQGAAGLLMTPAVLGNQAWSGIEQLGRGVAENVEKGINYGAEKLGSDFRVYPQSRGEIYQPFLNPSDVAKMTGAYYEPQTTAGKIAAPFANIGGNLLAGRGVQKVNTSLNKAPIPSTDEIYDASGKAYANADANGGILKAQALEKGINKAHADAGFQSQEGKEFAGKNDVTDALAKLEGFRGRNMTLKGAQEIDESLSESIDAHFDKINGLDKQGAKLIKIQQALRDTYKNAGAGDVLGGNKAGFDSWKQGQQLWSAARHADDIERVLAKGASADVPATAYKNGFKTLANNPDRMRGFTDAEQKAIRHAAKTGMLVGALKAGGSKLTTGIAGTVGGGGAGFAAGGPWGTALGAPIGAAVGQAAGFPLRAAANALQRGKGTDILNLIGTRPGLQSSMGLFPTTPTYNPNIRGAQAASLAAMLSNLNQ